MWDGQLKLEAICVPLQFKQHRAAVDTHSERRWSPPHLGHFAVSGVAQKRAECPWRWQFLHWITSLFGSTSETICLIFFITVLPSFSNLTQTWREARPRWTKWVVSEPVTLVLSTRKVLIWPAWKGFSIPRFSLTESTFFSYFWCVRTIWERVGSKVNIRHFD